MGSSLSSSTVTHLQISFVGSLFLAIVGGKQVFAMRCQNCSLTSLTCLHDILTVKNQVEWSERSWGPMYLYLHVRNRPAIFIFSICSTCTGQRLIGKDLMVRDLVNLCPISPSSPNLHTLVDWLSGLIKFYRKQSLVWWISNILIGICVWEKRSLPLTRSINRLSWEICIDFCLVECHFWLSTIYSPWPIKVRNKKINTSIGLIGRGKQWGSW